MIARARPVLIAVALSLPAPARCAPPPLHALRPEVALHSAEALEPAAGLLRGFAARVEGDGAAASPFLYGSGFLRLNSRGLDLDAGLLVDLGPVPDAARAAEGVRRFVSRASAAARAERGGSLLYLSGFDPASEEGRAFASRLAGELEWERGLSADSSDPYCYVVYLGPPGGALVPNTLFRNILPIGANVKYAFLSDVVRYTPGEEPGLKLVTIQLFFVAEIAGKRYVLSPTYTKESRAMVPQLAAFNALFTDRRGALLMEGLMEPYPLSFLRIDGYARMRSAMIASRRAGDKLKCLKRAHQALDMAGERIGGGARARCEGILKKYLSNDAYADAALLRELPAAARAYARAYAPPGPVDGVFAARFRALGLSLPRLSAAFPRASEAFTRWGRENEAVAALMERRTAGGEKDLDARLEKSAEAGRAVERLLIDDADLDKIAEILGDAGECNKPRTQHAARPAEARDPARLPTSCPSPSPPRSARGPNAVSANSPARPPG
jgi:hypothetical protein